MSLGNIESKLLKYMDGFLFKTYGEQNLIAIQYES